MTRRIFSAAPLLFCALAAMVPAQVPDALPKMNYHPIADFFRIPTEEHLVEPAGVAVNSKGHIYLFHRGKHPLMEFDASGKFIRSIADDLFVTAHMVRVDAEDNIWTTDIGSHMVLKLDPQGRVLLALGRMRIPGDDVLHFNQPTDVALDRDGNIYVTDGYGNSRVLKFDKYGNPLFAASDSLTLRMLSPLTATWSTSGTGRTRASKSSILMGASCGSGSWGTHSTWLLPLTIFSTWQTQSRAAS